MKYLFGHTSEATAYLVEDYPWGYTMRTQQRHWIETHPKHGDRHVTQTMNPKTGLWCKPKKSTYYAVMVLYIADDTGYLRSRAIHPSDNGELAKKYAEEVGEANLSDAQRNQLKRIVALTETMKHFTFECVPMHSEPINLSKVMQGDPEEVAKAEAEKKRQEEHKKQQKEMNHKMNQVFNYYMHK